MLETMAINELDHRRKRLEEYQVKARFALAESYDRATKAEVDAEIAKQIKARKKTAGETSQTEKIPEQPTPKQSTEQKEVSPQSSQDDVQPKDGNVTKGSRSSFKKKLLNQ